MEPLFLTVLAASLVGSVHCAGMCGGFVAFYSGSLHGDPRARNGQAPSLPDSRQHFFWGRWLAHGIYNAGRLVTYMTVGALAGWAGTGLDLAGDLAGVANGAAMVAGGSIAVWGGLSLARSLGVRTPSVWPKKGGQTPARHWLSRLLASLQARGPQARALLLGLSSTLLPCGWLYAFAVTAASTADPWLGAWTMFAFWLGTLPMMLAVGVSVQRLTGRLRRYIPSLTSVALIVVGMWALLGRVQPMLHPGSAGSGANGDLAPPACHETH